MIIVAHVSVYEQGVQENRIASGFKITINDYCHFNRQVIRTILLLLLI